MYVDDLKYLCCPISGEPLELSETLEKNVDEEILEGKLRSTVSGNEYKITNGIPRFVSDLEYNKSWDYKWRHIDKGKGLNYRITDKNDPAYKTHDLFDRNNHHGKAYEHARGKVVLDIGCGVGQYSWRLSEEYQPEKIVAMDLTGAVDIFRKIMLDRFPELKSKILIVQASVFEMPFNDESFDYVFSLGVLMHTGNTKEAVRQASRVVKEGGELNIWVYNAFAVHIDVGESNRKVQYTLVSFIPYQLYYIWVMMQINLFRRLPHGLVLLILRIFSSELWYRACRLPVLGYFPRIIFSPVMHPDRDYRYINNYDGWYNNWADTWTEQELFPVLEESDIVIRSISDWQTGIWGRKVKGFYN